MEYFYEQFSVQLINGKFDKFDNRGIKNACKGKKGR